jgi:hypothetical protein
VRATAMLPIREAELDQMIAQVRQELHEVVYMADRVYQKQLTIPEEVHQAALRRLARAGFRLYQRLFFGPAAGADSRQLGARLRELARQRVMKIQISSQKFLLPWSILYMADEYDENNVQPELFLGLKHIIEHIPLQQNMQVLDDTIDSRQRLNVSLNVNAGIDTQMRRPFVGEQVSYWDAIETSGKASVVIRSSEQDVLRALKDTATPDQILYFYCHAVSKSLAEGPDGSSLVLTTAENGLKLGDLHLDASTGRTLPGAPLVIINACESAELSPLFYDGFVPYFMDKGARGVIGTESEIPALFAVAWAKRFFDEFLNGKPLGKVVLDLRQEFYQKHRNLLGLLYAVYCDGDTRVDPSLQLTQAA